VGFQELRGSTTPIGTATLSPSDVFAMTSTVRVESSSRLFLAKSRITGCSRPTQISGEVAVSPPSSLSDLLCERPPT
jgi:hypothetical protein